MESGILDIREVKATRRGLKINLNSLRKVVIMRRSLSSGDTFAVISAYEAFTFDLSLNCVL